MSKDRAAKGKQGAPPRSEFWTSIKLLLIIVILVLIPLVMRDVQWQEENVALVGRIAGALCLTLIAYGLIKHLSRIVLILAVALIAVMVLASEGLIDLPRLIGK